MLLFIITWSVTSQQPTQSPSKHRSLQLWQLCAFFGHNAKSMWSKYFFKYLHKIVVQMFIVPSVACKLLLRRNLTFFFRSWLNCLSHGKKGKKAQAHKNCHRWTLSKLLIMTMDQSEVSESHYISPGAYYRKQVMWLTCVSSFTHFLFQKWRYLSGYITCHSNLLSEHNLLCSRLCSRVSLFPSWWTIAWHFEKCPVDKAAQIIQNLCHC